MGWTTSCPIAVHRGSGRRSRCASSRRKPIGEAWSEPPGSHLPSAGHHRRHPHGRGGGSFRERQRNSAAALLFGAAV